MTTPFPGSPRPAPAALVDPVPATARTADHDALDEALAAIRRVLLRPGYRARLLDGLPERVELATLRLLRTVQRSDAPPSIGDVAEVLTIDPSTASRVVDRAVAAGHLERQACAEDRRRARLQLTPAGSDLLDRVTDRRRALLAEVIGSWSDDEVRHLVGSLRELLAAFDALEASA